MGKLLNIHLASNAALSPGTKMLTSAQKPWSFLQIFARLHQKVLGERSRKAKSKIEHGLGKSCHTWDYISIRIKRVMWWSQEKSLQIPLFLRCLHASACRTCSGPAASSSNLQWGGSSEGKEDIGCGKERFRAETKLPCLPLYLH